ncbi:Elongin-A [Colletotrichum trifolii]|uniref:Elongin-A n=1 Tax=Colletotrichum trifolii TaxID=5466 RepID=A0A4R8QYK2_COLTR|nr:Elongin-A [Colletotrichum trifolii]
MPAVKSLAELCVQVCQRHITELTTVGNGESLQYRHVRDILFRVTNPVQLRDIEINSPHIQGETSELWQRLIRREFPSESHEKNYAPKNPTKWYKIYDRYAKERRESRAQAEAELRQKLQGLEQQRSSNVSKIVDAKYLPKPPKTGRTFSTRGRGGKDLPSSLNFAAGSRMKTTTGASVMKKARREAAEIAGIRSRLAVPTGRIRAPRISKAPPSMETAHRIAAQPVFRPTHTSSRPPASSFKATYLSDSSDGDGDCDGGEDEHEDDLFGGEETPKKKTRHTHATAISPAGNFNGSPTSLKSNTPFKASSTKPGVLPRGSGILANAPRQNRNIRVEGPRVKPEHVPGLADTDRSRRQAASHNGSTSPPSLPERLDESKPTRAATGNQELPKKRKAVDIFMPKKKTRR